MATCVARISAPNESIIRELSKFRLLRDRLLTEIPDIDSETLSDTLEGITDLRETLAEIIRSALDDEGLAAGLSTRLSDMKARLGRFEASAKRKRARAHGDQRSQNIQAHRRRLYRLPAPASTNPPKWSRRRRSRPRIGSHSRRSSIARVCWQRSRPAPLSRAPFWHPRTSNSA